MAPMAEMRRESTFAPLECQEPLLAMLSGPTRAERPIRCYNLDRTLRQCWKLRQSAETLKWVKL